METRTLTMTSQTVAMKAKRLLEKNGIYTRIVRPSPKSTTKGCAYGLQIEGALLSVATKYLEQNDIPYSDIL